MDSASDQQFSEWARRLQQSDEQALEELFEHTFENFVKFAWRYTKEKPSAVDIVQDAFIKIWQIREQLNPDRSFKTYMYRMIKNKALNYLRDHEQYDVSVDDLQLADPDSDELLSPDKTTVLSDKFSEWIESLPGQQRRAFELSRFEGLTHKEIAEVMDIAPRTVNNHIVSALNTLKELYEGYKADRTQVA
ncbi:MAG: RNA polymerase sigma-70 factor [Balneolaceae bacterium]|nr:RNA polymerase sigma-70 factor [Balneolaceae bacterium]